MARPQFPALSLTRSNESSTSTPPSSFIANLPPSPRSSSPAGRVPTTPRPPSQLRPRDSRPPYLPFRRISLPSTPGPGYGQKRDSIASVFSFDSVQEHDDEAPNGKGVVSASLPTESSMPDMGVTAPLPMSGSPASLNAPIPPPPPIPASRTPLSSSPSRRVVIVAPPGGGGSGAPITPSRVRPRPLSTHSLARVSNRSPGRTSNQSPGKDLKSRRPTVTRIALGEKEKQREEKRGKIAKELLDTEQSYVDGLDLVENHFLAPLIESLTTPQPLVTPADLSLIFPGFIDILNFSRSFLGEL